KRAAAELGDQPDNLPGVRLPGGRGLRGRLRRRGAFGGEPDDQGQAHVSWIKHVTVSRRVPGRTIPSRLTEGYWKTQPFPAEAVAPFALRLPKSPRLGKPTRCAGR